MLFTIAKWKNGSKAAYSSTWDDACKSSLFELTDIANKYNILTTHDRHTTNNKCAN